MCAALCVCATSPDSSFFSMQAVCLHTPTNRRTVQAHKHLTLPHGRLVSSRLPYGTGRLRRVVQRQQIVTGQPTHTSLRTQLQASTMCPPSTPSRRRQSVTALPAQRGAKWAPHETVTTAEVTTGTQPASREKCSGAKIQPCTCHVAAAACAGEDLLKSRQTVH
jgi:hypothetical protein